METRERVLLRRKQGRVLAGVAGGLADYTETPVRWWRWAFAAVAVMGWLGLLVVTPPVLDLIGRGSTWGRLALLFVLFAGGVAEWAYLLLWVLVPRADLPRSAGIRLSERLERWPGRLGLGLLVFVGGLLGAWLGLWGGVVVVATALIGAGLAVFRPSEEIETKTIEGDPMTTTEPLWNAGSEPALPLPPPPVPRPPKVRKERSKLGWLSLGLALVVGGVIWMLDASGTAHLTASQTLAAPLVVIGAGLWLGSFVGHAKWTALLGLLLIPVIVVSSAIGMPLTGRYEDRTIHVTSVGQLQPSYVQTGGRMQLDLSRLRFGANHPTVVRMNLGVGDITVVTSPCVPVDVAAHVNAGTISFPGRNDSVGGFSVSDSTRTKGSDPIELDLRTGLGAIEVNQGYVPKKERKKGCAS
ncbi:MAG: PspC domain-containing protein [Actinomycetota bacterium]|nr:PspC domain-containing protein [Actinomycetota bacterium]